MKKKAKPCKFYKAVNGKFVRMTKKEVVAMQAFKIDGETLLGIKAKTFPILEK